MRAIEQIQGKTIGHMGLGMHGSKVGTPRQLIHDGDTLAVRPIGDMGVRFLGVDTPEISFRLPGDNAFISIGHPRWEDFLRDPLNADWGRIELDVNLATYLRGRVGPGCAANHSRHAQWAEDRLEEHVSADLAAQGKTPEDFRFFLRFAREVMDGYGRLLGWINREDTGADRPLSYNERQLQCGAALPYFIWPNVNPFRIQAGLRAAVPRPGTAAKLAKSEASLRKAREWVAGNRANGIGVFEKNDPLRLEPFELRYLAQRRPPSRWVIDLSKNDDVLLPPQAYHTVPNCEDRLYIPDEYTELFVSAGWRKGS